MTGSLIVTWMKPVKNKLKLIGISTALVFSGNIFQSLSEYPAVWCGAAFGSYAMAAVMNAHMTVFMREQIPLDLQGRAFSIESTLKNNKENRSEKPLRKASGFCTDIPCCCV